MISPSPWSVSEKRVYVKDANGENVCAVSRQDDCALIAAAPDLFAALRDILDATEGIHIADREAGYFAIAKAEGR